MSVSNVTTTWKWNPHMSAEFRKYGIATLLGENSVVNDASGGNADLNFAIPSQYVNRYLFRIQAFSHRLTVTPGQSTFGAQLIVTYTAKGGGSVVHIYNVPTHSFLSQTFGYAWFPTYVRDACKAVDIIEAKDTCTITLRNDNVDGKLSEGWIILRAIADMDSIPAAG